MATSPPTARIAAPGTGPQPWFVGDFSTGDLSQWPYLGDAHGISIVAGDARAPSRHIARAVTTNAPDSSTAGDASYLEMDSFRRPWENEGADAWFGMHVLLPSGRDPAYPGTFTPNPPSSGWNMLMEWHTSPGAGPASPYVGVWNDGHARARLAMRLVGGDPRRPTSMLIKDPTPVDYDHWYDLAVRMKWSPDPAEGYVEWWIDGVRKFAGAFPTLYRRPDGSASSVLFDVGHYRGTQTWADTVYFGGVRVGPAQSSLASGPQP